MITIAVDGRPLQAELTGVGKYVWELILRLANSNQDLHFIIFTNKPLSVTINSTTPNITIFTDKKFEWLKPLLWSKFFMARLINRIKPDYTLCGGTFAPTQSLLSKKIIVVHDLNHIYAKETMSVLHYLTHVIFFKHDIKNASIVICNSKGTANKLKNIYDIKTDVIINPPISSDYQIFDKELVRSKLTEIDITYKYILSVATQEPRKNLDKTVAVFKFLSNDSHFDYKLLLVGGSGWKNDELQRNIKLFDRIVQLGYIDEKYLPYLYNGASAFVFPSKYEGYGMPATEALMCGVKPIVSDIEELREATAGNAFFIDPNDQKQYIEAIKAALIFNKEDHVFNMPSSANSINELLKLLIQ